MRKSPFKPLRSAAPMAFLLTLFVGTMLSSFFVSTAFAGSNLGITYQGILTNSSEVPYTTAQTVIFKIYDPSANACLLWAESQSITPDSKGRFSAVIGTGTNTASGSQTIKEVFLNAGTLSGLTCASGTTYTPTSSDDRLMTITVGGVLLSGSVAIKSLPFALQANQVSGYGSVNLTKISGAGSANIFTPLQHDFIYNLSAAGASSSTPCTINQILKFNGTAWACAADASGSSSNADYSAPGVVQFQTDAATSGVTVASGIATLNTGIAANQIPKLDASANLGVGTASPGAKLDVKGTLRLSGSTSGFVGFAPQAAAGGTTYTLPSADSTGTQYLRSNGSGTLSWGTPAGSGTVNSGTMNNLAYYAATGTAVSELATAANGVLVTSGGGVPSISSTLPAATQANITGLGTIASGTWQGTLIDPQYGGTGVNGSAAASGKLLIGNGTGYTLANISQGATQGVTITNGAGSITLDSAQDIRTTALPNFAGLLLNNSGTILTQSVSLGTSYSIQWPGNGASAAGSVLTSAAGGGLLSWTATLPAINGGTGQSSYTIGDILYASSGTALSKLSAGTSGYVLTSNGAGTAPSWQAAGGASSALSSLTAATSSTTIDNFNFAQAWNWSTATTQNPLSIAGNALTTGSLLSLTTSSASVNSTSGLLNVANTSATTNGTLARFQSNSTAGSGMTILADGNVGIGTTAPGAVLGVKGTLRLLGSSSGYVDLAPGAAAGGTTYTLPLADGSANQVLQTNGSGTLSWATPSGALPALTSANLWVGNGSNVATAVVPSGAVTMSNIGAFTLAASSVSDSNIVSVTTPGKVAIGAVASGSGISVGTVAASTTGLSISTISGSGTGVSVSTVSGASGKGVYVSGVSNATAAGVSVAGVSNGTGVKIVKSSTGVGIDISGAGTGNAINVVQGDTNVQAIAATMYTSGSGGSQGGPLYSGALDTLTGMFFPGSSVVAFTSAGSEIVRINGTGLLPATDNSYNLGSASLKFLNVYALSGVVNTSDRRLKKDITDTDLGLDFINKLRPVSYRWKSGVDEDIHYGLIAQEAELAIAEARGRTPSSDPNTKTSIVNHDEKSDRYGVRYSELISPLIRAVQEIYSRLTGVEALQNTQDSEIATLKLKASQLELENDKLKQDYAELKARLDKIEKALGSR